MENSLKIPIERPIEQWRAPNGEMREMCGIQRGNAVCKLRLQNVENAVKPLCNRISRIRSRLIT